MNSRESRRHPRDRPTSRCTDPGTCGPDESSPESHLTAVLGDITRQRTWYLPRNLRIHTLIEDVTLDLRKTTMESNSCRITLMSLIGNCTVIVPGGGVCERDHATILGDLQTAETGLPGDPEIEVRGFSFGGNLKVKTLAPGHSAGSGSWFDFLR
ncbi:MULTISPECIES: LiaF domain-containing protein [unclassified Corynebacterium]|uniref:LiaF domain-containing protein n=1 Tax=unclassified Corynebacterium TaxID=2624378 RepID=UPI003524992B